MVKRIKTSSKPRGSLLLLSILVTAGILATVTAVSTILVRELKVSKDVDNSILSYYGVEGTLEQGLYDLFKLGQMPTSISGSGTYANGVSWSLAGRDKTTASATDPLIFDRIRKNQSVNVNLYNLASTNQAAGVESITVECGLGNSLQISLYSWDGTTLSTNPTTQSPPCTGGSAGRITLNSPSATLAYKVVLTAINADALDVKVLAWSADGGAGSVVSIPLPPTVTGTASWGAAKQAMTASLPESTPWSSTAPPPPPPPPPSPPVLTTIVVTPNPGAVNTGATLQFSAQGKDQFGANIAISPAPTWGATGGTINSSGLYTAGVTAGTFTVTATSGSVAGSATVNVTVPAPVLTQIIVTPNPGSVNWAGLQMSAQGKDQFGANMAISPAPTWGASSGSINSTGFLTVNSSSALSITVTATSGSVSGNGNVTIPNPITWTFVSNTASCSDSPTTLQLTNNTGDPGMTLGNYNFEFIGPVCSYINFTTQSTIVSSAVTQSGAGDPTSRFFYLSEQPGFACSEHTLRIYDRKFHKTRIALTKAPCTEINYTSGAYSPVQIAANMAAANQWTQPSTLAFDYVSYVGSCSSTPVTLNLVDNTGDPGMALGNYTITYTGPVCSYINFTDTNSFMSTVLNASGINDPTWRFVYITEQTGFGCATHTMDIYDRQTHTIRTATIQNPCTQINYTPGAYNPKQIAHDIAVAAPNNW